MLWVYMAVDAFLIIFIQRENEIGKGQSQREIVIYDKHFKVESHKIFSLKR